MVSIHGRRRANRAAYRVASAEFLFQLPNRIGVVAQMHQRHFAQVLFPVFKMARSVLLLAG